MRLQQKHLVTESYRSSTFLSVSHWLDPIPSTPIKIRKPDELSHSAPKISHQIEVEAQSKLQFKRIYGSMLGMSVGDALGAPVEFRPNDYLKEHPVSDLQSGGTWGLAKGQVLFLFQTLTICFMLSSHFLIVPS